MSNAFAFQFIAGKYEGGVYLIPDDRDLMIGRGAELDVVLVEDMVSRRHASLASHEGRLVLTDLGSTNGTYVNGERVDQCELEAQDRVLIGTSILRVTPAEQIETLLQTHPALDLSQVAEQRTDGDLRDVPPGDLLRLFSSNRRTGLLKLRHQSREAEVVFVDGAISHASLEGRSALSPMACLVEALGMTQGTYSFQEPAEGFERPESFSGKAEETMRAAAQERSKIDALWKKSGLTTETALSLGSPQPGPWSAASFSPSQLDALQLSLVHGRLGAACEHATHGTWVMLEALDELTRQGYLQRRP